MSIHVIEPGLLLAAPRLGDPNFEATVVLLGLHDERDGSLGWIVNAPAGDDAAAVARATGLVPGGATLPHGFARPAVRGGPVSPESVWILYRRAEGEPLLPGAIAVGTRVAVTPSPDALRLLIQGRGPEEFRLLLGYAGWAPGQLANELASGTWLPAPVEPDVLFETGANTSPHELWSRAYERVIGTVPSAFVTAHRGSA